VINRNVTRTILNSTEATEKTKTPSDQALACALTTAGYLYLGFKQPFTTRYFHLDTPNTVAATLSVSFWDGTAWTAVEGLVDQTAGFTKSGFISWLNFGFWDMKTVSPITHVNAANADQLDLEHYWVRISTSANFSAATSLQSVLNLFCDSDLFRVYYPDLADDTRYLPPGRTDFMAQYLAAKDMVVMRLKQAGKIKDEGDILDVNEVAAAAVHATAWILLHPIATGDESRAKANEAYKALSQELSRAVQTVDTNSDGRLDASEKFTGTTWLSR